MKGYFFALFTILLRYLLKSEGGYNKGRSEKEGEPMNPINRVPSYQEYVTFLNSQGMSMGGPQYTQQPMQQAQMNNPNILPPQQVLQANGKPSINALRMSTNSSVLIMDSTAPMVWLCTSDGLGNVTPVPYDITPHKDTPAPDLGSFETRLAAVESGLTMITSKWEEFVNAKPNAGNSKSKQTVRDSGTV